jgi:probable rRNA maturation factor
VHLALRQAGEYGHGLDRELAFLAVHGLLHLRGYDHEQESGRRRMRAKEEEILALADLTRDAT